VLFLKKPTLCDKPFILLMTRFLPCEPDPIAFDLWVVGRRRVSIGSKFEPFHTNGVLAAGFEIKNPRVGVFVGAGCASEFSEIEDASRPGCSDDARAGPPDRLTRQSSCCISSPMLPSRQQSLSFVRSLVVYRDASSSEVIDQIFGPLS